MDGSTLHEAITTIDKAVTRNPLCYFINCVHPKNVITALKQEKNRTETVKARLLGIQGNASSLSPEELNNTDNLQRDSKEEWVKKTIELHKNFNIPILGGCCGTDPSYIKGIIKGCK